MDYACPRCGKGVQRKSSRVAGAAGGLVGVLIFSAFAPFHCEACGKIPLSEFPADVRGRSRMRSVGLILGAVAVFVAVIALLVYLRS